MNTPLKFYFDYISPNAYLAWHELRRIAHEYGRDVEPVPVLFAALLQAHNQVGPAEVRPKTEWMMRNCLRKASAKGLSLRAPASHPFNPLPSLRVTYEALQASDAVTIVDAFFDAAWARSLDISDPDVVAGLLQDCGLDTGRIMRGAVSAETKQGLRRTTDAAIADGVFGVPTVRANGELFFGYDDLPWLERCLADDDPIDEAELSAWLAVEPSAWRRRT